MACRSGCKTQDHASWGDCLRAAQIRTYQVEISKGKDGTAQKKWDRELEGFAAATKEGIKPDGTKWKSIDKARKLSDKVGAAYGRDFNQATPLKED